MIRVHLVEILTPSILYNENESLPLSALTPLKPLPFDLSQMFCLLKKELFAFRVYVLALPTHSVGSCNLAVASATHGHPCAYMSLLTTPPP